jgi:hypothetical protein
MTFGARHYVPVLKVKRGEKAALRLLSDSVCARVTPLLEIVERTNKTLDAHLNTAFEGLAEAVGVFGRCFIDTREIALDGAAAAAEVFRRAASRGIVFTPVTGVSRTADAAAALEYRTGGIALRLQRDEFEAGGLAASVRRFLDQYGIVPEDTDLIVDLGVVDNLVSEGVEALAAAFLAEVPECRLWKTFTLSGCAFPLSMGIVDSRSYAFVERSDWLAWRGGLHARRDTLPRLPTYSDCAIQHPRGVEGFDPRTMQMSASIRYTTRDSWLLIKGESTRRTPPSTQFPLLAKQLVYGNLRHNNYRGANHCAGCSFMKAAADGAGRLGSAEVWRKLGTIHHITTVVEELVALPWP